MTPDEPSTRPSRNRPTVRLHAWEAGAGPTVVLAHGFTQTSRTWGALVDDLAGDHHLVLVDLPGHGASAQVSADLITGADLVVCAGGRGTYLGYSMGARFCLHAALARPDAVEHLVLISGTAGIDDPGERRVRRREDGRLADELDPPPGGPPARNVEAFLERWLAQPLFAGIDRGTAALGERSCNTGAGLASSLRLAGTGTQQPLWGRLGALAMPVLIVAGELDAKFTDLGRRMARSIGPNASVTVVAGAGHAPHLERPEEVARLVRGFLTRATR